MTQGENLPAILSRAGNRLLDARSAAEVLEAKRLGEAALHYAKVTQAANETHADCLRIITRAEMRMADEIDRGRASGELAPAHRPAESVQGPDTSTYDDLGLDRRRVAEWREVRDAGPEVVETAIQSALAEGRPPTKADITKHVRGTFGTGDNEWFTPAEHVARARAVMGTIDLDPASDPRAQETIGAANFYTIEDDGLTREWRGRVWMNPPYAQPAISQFIDKLLSEVEAGRCIEAIALTHNYTDTAWFQKAAARAAMICFTRGRIRFVAPDGALAAPTQGQAFLYFGRRPHVFAQEFRDVGFVVSVQRAFDAWGEAAA